jgi:hypothetical protein
MLWEPDYALHVWRTVSGERVYSALFSFTGEDVYDGEGDFGDDVWVYGSGTDIIGVVRLHQIYYEHRPVIVMHDNDFHRCGPVRVEEFLNHANLRGAAPHDIDAPIPRDVLKSDLYQKNERCYLDLDNALHGLMGTPRSIGKRWS